MPNYAHAGLDVTGDPAELKRFAEKMIRPVWQVGMVALHDIPPPARADGPGPDTPEGRKPTLDFNGIIPMPSEDERPDWESSAVDDWGTKWNAQDVDVHVDDDKVWFQFSTAWEFPTPVFKALAAEFPALVFSGSALFDNEDLELVGEFNGRDDWGSGRIEWVEFGDGSREDDDGGDQPLLL